MNDLAEKINKQMYKTYENIHPDVIKLYKGYGDNIKYVDIKCVGDFSNNRTHYLRRKDYQDNNIVESYISNDAEYYDAEIVAIPQSDESIEVMNENRAMLGMPLLPNDSTSNQNNNSVLKQKISNDSTDYMIDEESIVYQESTLYEGISNALKLKYHPKPEDKLTDVIQHIYHQYGFAEKNSESLSIEIIPKYVGEYLNKGYYQYIIRLKSNPVPGLKSITEAVDTNSIKYQTYMNDIVNRQLDYLREKRKMDVKGKISKIPVLISVISVLIFIPLLLIIILGPVILEYL
jgi:hypothetical protein